MNFNPAAVCHCTVAAADFRCSARGAGCAPKLGAAVRAMAPSNGRGATGRCLSPRTLGIFLPTESIAQSAMVCPVRSFWGCNLATAQEFAQGYFASKVSQGDFWRTNQKLSSQALNLMAQSHQSPELVCSWQRARRLTASAHFEVALTPGRPSNFARRFFLLFHCREGSRISFSTGKRPSTRCQSSGKGMSRGSAGVGSR